MSALAFDFNTEGADVARAFAKEAEGRTVLITGASAGGVGAQTAIDLATGAQPAHLILAGRTKDRVRPVIDEVLRRNPNIKTDFVEIDLASQTSVRRAAKSIGELTDSLDVLINNAGIMAVKEYTTTPEGIELQFGTNHVGHFLLTVLVLHLLRKGTQNASAAPETFPTRIINVSSNGSIFSGIRFEDYNFRNGELYDPWLAYGQSKTANILFSRYLASRLEDDHITAFSLTPGLVLETNLQNDVSQEMFAKVMPLYDAVYKGREKPPFEDPKPMINSASTTLRAALDPSLSTNKGGFLQDCQIRADSSLEKHAVSDVDAEKLIALSERLVGARLL